MHDVIVIGTGGVGSATLYELARRGANVLGLDRFSPGHDRGSSHGQTRIIRRSYFEHPDYVPLLNMAYDLWDELCELRAATLLNRTGLVYVASADGPVIGGVLESAGRHHLEVDQLTPEESTRRFPGFAVMEDATVLFERDAGYLLVEECVKACIEEAGEKGAVTRHGETVRHWSAAPNGIVVETDKGRYAAERLVITAGCWTRDLLHELNIPLRIMRKHMHWYAIDDHRYSETNACPCFFYETMGGYFYGVPNFNNSGVKVAEHSGGTKIDGPLTTERSPEIADTARIESFLKNSLSGAPAKRIRHEICFYTMSPDENFIIDRHPDHDNVVFAAGLSGHGFKFASALGRVLTELTLDGAASVNIDFLSLNRPGLQA